MTRPEQPPPSPHPSPAVGRAIVVAVVLAGCGAAQQPSALTVRAPGPGRPLYSVHTSEPAVFAAGRETELRAAVRDAARAQDLELTGDERLATLARWTGQHGDGRGELPPREVIDFFARHLGLVEALPEIFAYRLGPDGSLSAVRRELETTLGQKPYSHYGAAVLPGEGAAVVWVSLSWRPLELDPVARRVDAGEPIRLHGRLPAGYQDAKVRVHPPNEDIRVLSVGAGPGFDVHVPTSEAGDYQLSVQARGPIGTVALASFPVYVGKPVPTTLSLLTGDARQHAGLARVRRELLRLTNRERQKRGLEPLQFHVGLSAVAERHSADMRDNGYRGHESPTTGTPSERVERAGLGSGLVLENIVMGPDAAAVYRRLMRNPGQRSNLLNTGVTHAGVGVVLRPRSDGSLELLVTQLFVRLAELIDVNRAPDRLLSLLNRAREARGAPPLESDPDLAGVAARAAEGFFRASHPSEQDVLNAANSELERFSIAYKRVGGVVAVVTELHEAAQLEPALEPDARHVGIGVMQGSRPDTGPRVLAVVILLAWPR